MKIAIDSCSIILLAKATVLETFAHEHSLLTTEEIYKEVLEGKDKKLIDALLTERLIKEKKIGIIKATNKGLIKKLVKDLNLGIGEAGALSLVMDNQCEAIATDNKQGRKAATIHGLNLIGSIDVIVALYKLKLISKDKAVNGLRVLREFGWFHDYLIDSALEEIKNV